MNEAARESFVRFSTSHLVALGIVAAVPIILLTWRNSAQNVSARVVRTAIGGLLFAFFGWHAVQHGIMHGWREAIPLHLCDLTLLMTAAALVTLKRFPFEFAYFFGLGGAIQALVTPDLERPFPSPNFLLFFSAHGAIVAGVFVLVICCGMRPGPAGPSANDDRRQRLVGDRGMLQRAA